MIPNTLCYLNGEYTPLNEAKISVLDRGFIFGDGVYEVLPFYAGKPFRFEEHMARLSRSLSETRITNPHKSQEWLAIAKRLCDLQKVETGAIDQIIYIQVSRGVAPRDHVMVQGVSPTVFVMVNAMSQPSAADRLNGVACVMAEDFRWQKAHIKSTSLLGAVFARQISFDADAVETVMFRDGFLSEAAACNVWAVKNGIVLGALKDHLVLEGMRYGFIEEACKALGLGFELRKIAREEVFAADELMLSSATKEVLPITLLDGKAVGSGKPGVVYAKLYAAYQEAKYGRS
jgi:D-alanine transaminase